MPMPANRPPRQLAKGQTLTRTMPVIDSKELPAELAKLAANDDSGRWVWATTEEADSIGDTIVVAGMRWDERHAPPDKHLPFLAQHLRALPDGKAAIVGRAELIVKTVHPSGKPAVAIYMSWAKDGKGKITELAQSYKDLVEGGYLNTVSIGFMYDEWTFDEESGGYKFIATRLYECSWVSVPCNANATAAKAIGEKLGGLLDDAGRQALKLQPPTAPTAPSPTEFKTLLAEHVAPLAKTLDGLVQSVDGLIERFDAMESAWELAKSKGQEPAPHPGTGLDPAQLKALNQTLDRLGSFLGK